MFPNQSPHASCLPSGETFAHRIASVSSLYIKLFSTGISDPSSVRSGGGAFKCSNELFGDCGVPLILI